MENNVVAYRMNCGRVANGTGLGTAEGRRYGLVHGFRRFLADVLTEQAKKSKLNVHKE